MKINERFIWATEVLAIKRTDRILEIGCGAGILVEQIALQQAVVTGVDSSAAMIKMAIRRNKTFADKGSVEFVTSDFAEAEMPPNAYNKILAFNVNFFWKDPSAELALIKKCLKKNGLLYVFYQAPYEITIEAAKPIEEKLRSHQFTIVDTLFKKMTPVSAFCIIAKPS